eukprot:2006840-Pleurochrysis_carterae.AAC.1
MRPERRSGALRPIPPSLWLPTVLDQTEQSAAVAPFEALPSPSGDTPPPQSHWPHLPLCALGSRRVGRCVGQAAVCVITTHRPERVSREQRRGLA